MHSSADAGVLRGSTSSLKRYRELNARFLVIASAMGVGLSEADIRKTTEIVRQLNDDVKGRSALG